MKAMTHTSTEQAEVLRLADVLELLAMDMATPRAAASELRAQHARIAELEQRLEIDPRHRYDGISARDATIEAQDERIAELESQLEAIGAGGVEPLRKQVAPPIAWPKDAQADVKDRQPISPRSIPPEQFYAAERREQAAAQGMELANCKGGKWLTVVYRDIQPGDEARTIGEHPKVSALSWSHALNDRDAALAAQAKQGEKP